MMTNHSDGWIRLADPHRSELATPTGTGRRTVVTSLNIAQSRYFW
jgi:hypothetical protein